MGNPNFDADLDAYDIPTVCRRSGMGREFVYGAIRRGELVARKFGRATRILRSDYEAWLRAAPTMGRPEAEAASNSGSVPGPVIEHRRKRLTREAANDRG